MHNIFTETTTEQLKLDRVRLERLLDERNAVRRPIRKLADVLPDLGAAQVIHKVPNQAMVGFGAGTEARRMWEADICNAD